MRKKIDWFFVKGITIVIVVILAIIWLLFVSVKWASGLELKPRDYNADRIHRG